MWARIMAPLSGGQGDRAAVAAAVMLAEPFGAEVTCVYTPADVADVMPWMGEGFLGGVQTTALESLKEAAQAATRKFGAQGTPRMKPLQELEERLATFTGREAVVVTPGFEAALFPVVEGADRVLHTRIVGRDHNSLDAPRARRVVNDVADQWHPRGAREHLGREPRRVQTRGDDGDHSRHSLATPLSRHAARQAFS